MILRLREELLATGAPVTEEGGPEALRVSPTSIAALGRAVAVLRARKLEVRVRGSGDAPTAPPVQGALLDLSGLDRISSVDGKAGLTRVEAGCSVAALEAAARRAASTLGPLLPSVRAGSVGAWLGGPTRGERGVPGARRETAALSVAAVLADGKIAESRAAPRSSAGPDLDHLSLGGSGRLSVIAAAWIRLFPATPALSSGLRCAGFLPALLAVEELCALRRAPARARLAREGDGVRLALSWEGSESARLDRARAERTLRVPGCVPDADPDVGKWLRSPCGGHPIEVDVRWPALRALAAAPLSEVHLVGLHAGGAFAVLSLEGAASADECAARARASGCMVVAPHRLRDRAPAWAEAGAGEAWRRLVEALSAEEAP